MCQFFGVSRSGYYSYVARLGKIEKDAPLAEKLKEHQTNDKKDKELLLSFTKEYNEKTFTI